MPLFILLFFALMGGVGYLATFNPGKVTFFLSENSSVELALTALILFSTALGGLLVIISFGVREMKHMFLHWRELRQEKRGEQIDLHYTDAANAFLAKRYRDGTSLFKKILSINPNHLNSLLKLGEIYRVQGDFNEAVRLHRKARNQDDQSIEVLLTLSRSLEEAERFEEAMQFLREIIRLDGGNLTALIQLRDLTMRIQQWEDSYPLQEKILKLQLSEEEKRKEEKVFLGINYELGRQLLQKNESSEARRYFKAAIKQDKTFLPAHIGLGDTYFSKDKNKEAAESLEKSFELTGNLILLLRLEDFFIETGEPERVLEIYQKRSAKEPQNIVLRFYLGRLYYRLEMIDDAFETLSEIEPQVESFPDLFKILGNIHVRRGDLDFAIEAFKKGLKLKTRVTIPYYCPDCDNHSNEWAGRCERCGIWDSYIATPILVDKSSNRDLIEAPVPYPTLPVAIEGTV